MTEINYEVHITDIQGYVIKFYVIDLFTGFHYKPDKFPDEFYLTREEEINSQCTFIPDGFEFNPLSRMHIFKGLFGCPYLGIIHTYSGGNDESEKFYEIHVWESWPDNRFHVIDLRTGEKYPRGNFPDCFLEETPEYINEHSIFVAENGTDPIETGKYRIAYEWFSKKRKRIVIEFSPKHIEEMKERKRKEEEFLIACMD